MKTLLLVVKGHMKGIWYIWLPQATMTLNPKRKKLN